jgi:DNA-binding transcriptional MerR regulator
VEQLPEQGTLFADPLADSAGEAGAVIGYRGPTACSAAGITYRQLDYWARTGLVVPTIRSATGSGSQRLYSFKDILVLKVVKRLLDAGVSLQNIRVAVEALRARGVDDLAQVTLLSDGTSVYECTSSEEVVDLLRGGQGVFGIAVSAARTARLAGPPARRAGRRHRGRGRPDAQGRAVPPPAGADRDRLTDLIAGGCRSGSTPSLRSGCVPRATRRCARAASRPATSSRKRSSCGWSPCLPRRVGPAWHGVRW